MATDKATKKSSPSIAIWAITPNGLVLGQDICAKLSAAKLFASESLINESRTSPGSRISRFKKLSQELSRQFTKFSAHVFIFSTGIAVRIIAPLIQSKTIDPAVIVVDDNGINVISLLSGHLGGANSLTMKIAELIDAKPIITTATDINQLPSIDLIAQKNNLFIKNPEAIKHVNMVFLKNENMDVHDPLNCLGNLIPQEFVRSTKIPEKGAGVVCTWKTISVPRETLILRPKVLSVGIGCNRNTPEQVIHEFLKDVFRSQGLSLNSVFTLATTRVKEDETGLLKLADNLGLPLELYDNDLLNSVETIENPSKMVEKHLGVKSVCEAAAILAANRGRLIVPKHKNKDVTIAVAIKG